ncbi:protein of unknown function [endosymbiont DhMRE of Dentiscutata heterogama]|uniref:hypothetical protein n=1 Tax=endosymbiont DhMRE of Dentiscutata heterogama TaxID=1609546 RepID=UPI00063A61B7|nr:hypothetical protein [endosymbiont DhMRE of Dentiscutata heterogama]CFW92706.1 protein of unknown function [endosymbiont DhMRE of Dentiscutata heterogama]
MDKLKIIRKEYKQFPCNQCQQYQCNRSKWYTYYDLEVVVPVDGRSGGTWRLFCYYDPSQNNHQEGGYLYINLRELGSQYHEYDNRVFFNFNDQAYEYNTVCYSVPPPRPPN